VTVTTWVIALAEYLLVFAVRPGRVIEPMRSAEICFSSNVDHDAPKIVQKVFGPSSNYQFPQKFQVSVSKIYDVGI
jgi:hypothetical protein